MHANSLIIFINGLRRLYTWKAQFDLSDSLLQECLIRCDHPEDRARILRLRSRNHWTRGNYSAALNDNTLGLHLLGVDVNAAPSRREADLMFEQVKNEVWERSNASICVTLDVLHRSWRRVSKPFCLCLDVKMKRSISP